MSTRVETAAHPALEPKTIEAMKARLAEGRAALSRMAESMAPTRGHELVVAATDIVDEIVSHLALAALDPLEKHFGRATRTMAESVAIVAVGGYGRRELCPRSDVDILFLIPRGVSSDRIADYFNAILYGLWDLGFEVGHAVRTVSECISIAQSDQAVKTGLLDARMLLGPTDASRQAREGVYAELNRAIEREFLSGKGASLLISQKLEEAERRRERFGNSVYLLEPNVKASEGGLRELHTALWIAHARWRAIGIRDLLRVGVLSPREGRELERAYGFLLRVRSELHLASGRRQDSLGFEYQELIAKTLGYVRGDADDPDRRKIGVERFMRKYYYYARQIRHLAQLLIERSTSHPQSHPSHAQRANGGFKVWGGTLTVAERDQFEKDPAALIRIFRVSQEDSLEIYSYTKELIRGSMWYLDQKVRRRPEVVSDFLALLEDPKADGSILDVMHDLGVLRRLIPEVARVTARWQHSLYHVYTVDIHSLFTVKNLKLLRNGGYSREQPELTRLVAELPRPNVLYLAGFLHDIGKGWNRGDHSERGAAIARAVGNRLRAAGLPIWTEEDTIDLIWLVKKHLMMSDISQRRDVSDHDLIASFAEECRTIERLTMLYLLTFADMKSTSPKVWSDWKGTLLREVFEITRHVLSAGERVSAEETSAAHVGARRRRASLEILAALAERHLEAPAKEVVEAFAEAMPARYMLSMPARLMLRHIEMWREVSERGGFALHIRHMRRDGTTKLTIVCPDRPGLLALLAGTLAANRLQILSAQIFSMEVMRPKDGGPPAGGLALDVLYLKDENGSICEDPARWAQVRADLSQMIFSRGDVGQLLDQRLRGSTLKQRPKPQVKTEIAIANEVSKTETVIDVFCPDRLGVLYIISKALADAGLTISVAKISTQGDRVADGFYVTDAKTGLKVQDRDRLDAIKSGVRSAIESVATS